MDPFFVIQALTFFGFAVLGAMAVRIWVRNLGWHVFGLRALGIPLQYCGAAALSTGLYGLASAALYWRSNGVWTTRSLHRALIDYQFLSPAADPGSLGSLYQWLANVPFALILAIFGFFTMISGALIIASEALRSESLGASNMRGPSRRVDYSADQATHQGNRSSPRD